MHYFIFFFIFFFCFFFFLFFFFFFLLNSNLFYFLVEMHALLYLPVHTFLSFFSYSNELEFNIYIDFNFIYLFK